LTIYTVTGQNLGQTTKTDSTLRFTLLEGYMSLSKKVHHSKRMSTFTFESEKFFDKDESSILFKAECKKIKVRIQC